jgi:hypothetical protein
MLFFDCLLVEFQLFGVDRLVAKASQPSVTGLGLKLWRCHRRESV